MSFLPHKEERTCLGNLQAAGFAEMKKETGGQLRPPVTRVLIRAQARTIS
jgi:hypothetical protein